MKKYIEIVIGGKRYRFLIDEELDKTLKASLKDRYKFDSNNTLIISDDDLVSSYNYKQLILKSILNQISTFDLTPDLQRKIDTLKDYVGNRYAVYSSDLAKLESVLGEAGEIYGSVRSSLSKKEVAEKQREQVKDNLDEIGDIVSTSNYKNDNITETTSSTHDKLDEFKAIIEEISYVEEIKDKVPINDINDAMDRVVICSSMNEFREKTGTNVGSYDIVNAIKNKNEKIILPPNSKLEDVAVEILKTCINDQTIIEKIVTYVERKSIYQNKTNEAFEALRSSLKVSGLSVRNLNYFGDQFFDSFEGICRESGMSFEAMFADYFNSYSANRKYNSPMDKFIRLFNKYNGGDDNTKALLEAMLVKKAIARGLISNKYNNYLKEEYRNLSVGRNGYLNLNENYLRNSMGGISSREDIQVNNNISSNVSNIVNTNEENIANVRDNQNIRNKDEANQKEFANEEFRNEQNDNDIKQFNNVYDFKRETNVNAQNQFVKSSKRGGEFSEVISNNSQIKSQTKINGQMGFRKNHVLNASIYNEDVIEDEDSIEEDSNSANDSLLSSTNNSNSNIDLESDDEKSADQNVPLDEKTKNGELPVQNAVKDAVKKKAKSALGAIIKKNPWVIGTFLAIFLLIVLLLIISAGAYEEDINKNGLSYLEKCSTIDLKTTTLSREEFISKVEEHYAGGSEKVKTFASHAGTIYDISKEYNINPEIVVVRSEVEGFSPGTGYNYWGLGCYNGASTCLSYSSFTEGLKAYLENISQYDTILDMAKKYAYIGKYWFNPGGSGLGGCYYFPYISEFMSEKRASEVAYVCGDNAPACSNSNTSNCTATTDEDQEAYASYQVERMADVRSSIFGLDPEVCENFDNYEGFNDYNFLYTTSSGPENILNESLANVLRSKGTNINDFNEFILNNIVSAKVGTRQAAVSAALSLVWTLYDGYGVRLPYTWAGQHYETLYKKGTQINLNHPAIGFYGADPNWGTKLPPYVAVGVSFTNYGPDCSGFVSWVLHNAGYDNEHFTIRQRTLGTNYTISQSNFIGKPGDIMVNSHHVVFIVGVDTSKGLYYIAHASGQNDGVKISTVPIKDYPNPSSADRYILVDMDDYYQNHAIYTESNQDAFIEKYRSSQISEV